MNNPASKEGGTSRTKSKIAKSHKKIANIRKDFCHKKSKAKSNENGGWDRNNASAKAGLNKSILDKGWYQLEGFTKYKAKRAGKTFFKILAQYTSPQVFSTSLTLLVL